MKTILKKKGNNMSIGRRSFDREEGGTGKGPDPHIRSRLFHLLLGEDRSNGRNYARDKGKEALPTGRGRLGGGYCDHKAGKKGLL